MAKPKRHGKDYDPPGHELEFVTITTPDGKVFDMGKLSEVNIQDDDEDEDYYGDDYDDDDEWYEEDDEDYEEDLGTAEGNDYQGDLRFNTERANDRGVYNEEHGVWRTIRGARVYIEDGTITKGPRELRGKRSSDFNQATDGDKPKGSRKVKIKGRNIQKEKELAKKAIDLVQEAYPDYDPGELEINVRILEGVAGKSAPVGTAAGGMIELARLGSKGFNDEPLTEEGFMTAAVHELVHDYQEKAGIVKFDPESRKKTYMGVIDHDNYNLQLREIHARMAENWINGHRKYKAGELSKESWEKYYSENMKRPEWAFTFLEKRHGIVVKDGKLVQK